MPPGDGKADNPDGQHDAAAPDAPAFPDAAVEAAADAAVTPIPSVDAEPPQPCPEALASTDYFQFLDDLCHAKRLPAAQDRDRACPVADPSADVVLTDGTSVHYGSSTEPIEIDTTALAGLVPAGMNITVILIKRVAGIPRYRYLSNGTHDDAFQPWSSTKFLAVANAAATLRIRSS